MRSFLVRLGASFLFTGMFPIAPATFASAVTLAIFWFLPPLSPITWALLFAALGIGGTWLAQQAEKLWGHDASHIVIDEVLGVLLTIVGLGHGLGIYAAGFLLFRVFDVVKPPPAYQLQSLPGGFGVMADDVMAGIYGNLALRAILHFWPALATLGAA